MNPKQLRLGLIGAGTFGRFSLEQYSRMADIRPVAVADANPEAARRVAEEHGLTFMPSPRDLIESRDIDFIHIATPPSTHYDLAVQALERGKHVLCEKPLATTMEDAHEMAQAARKRGRVLGVNFIMRYDPLCEVVSTILTENLLGRPLHAIFENYATDEALGPGHWFWKAPVSGGIFIEHGVHFFDLYRMWFGEGRVVSGQRTLRPNTEIVEQVNCSAIYGEDVVVNFYHGFHQAARMDRQEFTILCERGDIRLYEWLPTSIRIDAILGFPQLNRLREIIPNVDVEEVARYTGDQRRVQSRHKAYEVDGRYCLRGNAGLEKMEVYGEVLRSLMQDQVEATRNPSHLRRVSDENGIVSLKMAIDADRLANAYATDYAALA